MIDTRKAVADADNCFRGRCAHASGTADTAADLFKHDGDVDLLLMNAGEPPVLLRNDGGNRNNWLGIKLVGTKSNRDGIGTLVTVKAGTMRRTKQLLGGTSYCSASDLRLLFGLGNNQKIEEVDVRWPSGLTTTLKDVAINHYLTIREDAGQPVKRSSP